MFLSILWIHIACGMWNNKVYIYIIRFIFYFIYLKSTSRCIPHTSVLVKKTSVKTLRWSFSAEFWRYYLFTLIWWSSTPRFDSTPERTNKNINLNKHLISSSGGRTHNQSSFFLLPTFTVTHLYPCAATVLFLFIYI